MDAILSRETDMPAIIEDGLVKQLSSTLNTIAIYNNDDDDDEESELYSTWIDKGGSYSPAVNLKIVDKMPSGVYKILWKNDDFCITPLKVNTDELYRFSEDFTESILIEAEKFWDKAETFKKYKLIHKRGILLAGSPGCGKTAIINLLIQQLITKDGLVFVINNAREFDLYIEALKSVVRTIEPNRPIITIIEDIDQLLESKGSRDAEILDLLDGKNSIEHHLVIMTSNNTSELSEALLRPSRIDLLMEIPEPNETIRREFYTKKRVPDNILDEMVRQTEGMTFAEMKEVFTGVVVLGKDIHSVVTQVSNPKETKDYLIKPSMKIGL